MFKIPGFSFFSTLRNRKGKIPEVARENSETMFEGIANAAPIGLGIAINRKIQWVNDNLLRIVGRRKEEVIGNDSRIFYENDEGYIQAGNKFYADLKKKGSAEIEVSWAHKDGRILNIFLTGAILDRRDISRGIIFTAADITERKKIEAQARKASADLQLIFKNMINAFIVWESVFDAQGNYVSFRFGYFNDSYARISGLKQEEVLGKDVFEVWPATEQSWVKAYGEVAVSGNPKTFDMFHGPTQGWYHCNAYRPTESPRMICVIFEDITERILAEKKIYKLNEELEDRVRERTGQLESANKELEAFSYSVSHDLRAPLRGIDGFSKLLLDDYADKIDDTGKDYLNRVRVAVKNMSELIEDLLSLSRVSLKELEFKWVDLSKIAREISVELKAQTPQRQVEFVIQPGLVSWGDAHLLESALRNIFDNAWKYTSKHPSAQIEFGVTKFKGQDAYFVRDDGVGFDRAFYDKLFKPFQRLHSLKDYPGTGIGLVTIRRIIEKHGGCVWAESGVEKGTTVYFILPKKSLQI
jgi:PAS domain S-box-containing protein